MNDYSQPDFYRFNQDSLILVKWIVDQDLKPRHLLDLGAGCGIIGIELARNLGPESVTLVELQSEYLSHLEVNVKHFLPSETAAKILIQSFSEIQPGNEFDLIVCNPPYYLPGKGQLPHNPNRSLARTFLQDDWRILLKLVQTQLSVPGKAFMVVKNQPELLQEIKNSQPGLKIIFHQLSDLVVLEINHSEYREKSSSL
jgi:tRNA1(Val) A37 N6-methylase TrmN6